MPHFICTACGTQYPDSAEPPPQCVICEEERQYVPPRGQTWTTLVRARARPFQQLPGSRAGRHRHRQPAAVCHRPARAAGAHARRQRVVGLHLALGRRHRHAHQGAGRHSGHRHLAPAFLHHHGGVGAHVRMPHPPARRRRGMGDAAGCGGAPLGRRDADAVGWRHAGALRRSFPRRHGAALGGRRLRPRHRLFRRYPYRDDRPQMAVVHAQLSEPDPALAPRGGAYRAGAFAVLVRDDLRPLLRPCHRARWQRGVGDSRWRAMSRPSRARGGTKKRPRGCRNSLRGRKGACVPRAGARRALRARQDHRLL